MVFGSVRRALLSMAVAFSCGSTFAFAQDALGANFTEMTKHRLHVALSGTPEGFREALINADTDGLIDDIAVPTTLDEADLAIFYFASTEELLGLKFFDELEPLKDRILEGVRSPTYTLGLSLGGQNGPRPLRLFFFNVAEVSKDLELRERPVIGVREDQLDCLAIRIYALSIFEEPESVLARLSTNCSS